MTFERIITEFRPSIDRGPVDPRSGPPERVAQWATVSVIGVSDGPVEAPVHIVELADLECSFCKRFHEVLSRAKAQFPERIRVTWIHHPLTTHRFARPAARASECARASGRFQEFVDAVFAKQDSLGLRSWTAYAVEAGVSDTADFHRCAGVTGTIARIEDGLRLGAAIGVRGTPTVLLNGWKYQSPPSDSLLFRTIREVLKGGDPLQAFQRGQ